MTAATTQDEYDDAYHRIPGYASHLDRIRDARIMVVGVGALGNEVVKNLVLFNVGHLFLCDFDTVETANLSHSVLFRPGDENRKKVDVARDRIREMNPRIQVTAFGSPLSEIGLGVWREMDVIVGCLDNRGSRVLIDRYCGRAGKDWIDAGLSALVQHGGEYRMAGLLKSVVQKFSPSKGIRYENYLQNDEVRAQAENEARLSREASPNWEHCSDVRAREEKAGRVPTTPTMASLTGAIQAQEAIRMLSPEVWGQGGIEGRRLIIRADTFEMQQIVHPAGEPVLPAESVIMDETLSARGTTLRQMLLRAREDLGSDACVELGFQYCMAMRCGICGHKAMQPFKLGSQTEFCPNCTTDALPIRMGPLDDGYFADTLGGFGEPVPPEEIDDPFWDTTLAKLGVPLYDVLTASVYSYASGRDELVAQKHYALAGDAEAALGWTPRS